MIRYRLVFPILWILVMSSLAPAQQVPGQADFIDRRSQARSAFLTAPRETYRHYCAHCHGEDARGNGRLWASGMQVEPPDLTQLGQDQDYLVTAITEGSSSHGKSNLCPAWGETISAINVQRLAQYILAQGTPADDTQTVAASALPAGESFPWLLSAVLVIQLGLLLRMLAKRRL